MPKQIILFFIFCITLFAQPVKTDHAEVELISEVNSIKPGQKFSLALHVSHEDQWHTYWRNAGDAGIPTKFEWTLPNGFTAGDIQWPYPHRIMLADVANYGYEGELYLLTEITPPSNLEVGTTVNIKLKATWLICKLECLPGWINLELNLPVSNEISINKNSSELFNRTREKLPIANHNWQTIFKHKTDTSFSFKLIKPEWINEIPDSIWFYPYEGGYIKNSADQNFIKSENGYEVELKLEEFIVEEPDTLRGTLVSENGWRGEGSEKAIEISIPVIKVSNPESESSEYSSILLALIFAFAGGIILNLMPCVLPVLSIKILGFAQQAGQDSSKILKHGLFFTLGVVISFLALAGLLLILREGGQQLGWGFQLQSPLFLIILSVLLMVFSLSLFGVFEIGTSAANLGSRIENRGGNFGAVLSGVAATVLATPCTAPFMGSALGFAITQPAYITLVIFISLGLGMAFPYLLLSVFPKWLKYIPKPGSWMETLKQLMGFLLLATIIWLAWVLSLQAGSNAVIGLLGALLFSGLASWIYGKWGSLINSRRARLISTVTGLVLILGSVMFANSFVQDDPIDTKTYSGTSSNLIKWEKFSSEKLDKLVAVGKPVFIDFTAAWCLSCQVNEKVALNTSKVAAKFEELNITALKADWTSRDPEITKALAKFGRNSVPLYVLYDGSGNTPRILPEILTPGIVLEELNKF